MNLTAIEGVDPNLALRATVVNSTDGCRWLDDGAARRRGPRRAPRNPAGTDLEIVYFDWDAANATVERIRFMGAAFGKVE